MIITAFKIQDDVTFFRQERLWSLRGALLKMSQGCADTRWGETGIIGPLCAKNTRLG